MGTNAVFLTTEEQEEIQSVLPMVRKTSPEAAKAIRRVLNAVRAGDLGATSTYASVSEVAKTFGVTDQTIRNWADWGWIPSVRRFKTGPRKIPRSVLASAEALSRPRPPLRRQFSDEEIEAIVSAPRRPRNG